MRLIVFSSDPPEAMLAALAAEGFAVERRELSGRGGDGTGASLAAALREVEAALEDARPRAVLVAGAGDEALVAAVTAVKLGIPTAVAAGDAPAVGASAVAAIAAHVADLEVPATQDAGVAARAIRALAAPTLSAL